MGASSFGLPGVIHPIVGVADSFRAQVIDTEAM